MDRQSALFFTFVFILAVLIDIYIIVRWRRKRIAQGEKGTGTNPLTLTPLLVFFKNIRLQKINLRFPQGKLPSSFFLFRPVQPAPQPVSNQTSQWVNASEIAIIFEIAAIILWAIWVGRNVLIFSPYILLNGTEFANLIQTHFIWTNLPRCGLCFLWNGSINGGAPAFPELSGAILHPLVFIPILLWGVVDGAKVTLIASLAMAGLAQWALVGKLGMGRTARLWTAFIIVTGGHLVGKMENGNLALVLGLASANLVLMFGLDLLLIRNRRSIAWLGAATALLLLSGEGYIQIGAALTLFPILLLIAVLNPEANRQAIKDYGIALVVAILLSGVFLIPLLHFLPQIYKDSDISLQNFPPLEYIPLSLIIRDINFYRTQVLGNNPYLYTHMNYVGWVPVLLALASPILVPERMKKLVWILWAGVLLVFLITSENLPKILVDEFELVAKVRHLTVASGLAVPMIILLASITLDRLVRSTDTRLSFANPNKTLVSVPFGQMIMIPIAILSIIPAYNLSQEFLTTRTIRETKPDLMVLSTPTSQWIEPPYGYYDWTILALANDMKIAKTWRPWYWKYHENPVPYRKAVIVKSPDIGEELISENDKFKYYQNTEAEYAAVESANSSEIIPCLARSLGGRIDVTCTAKEDGILRVHEYYWSGWQAWVDGKRVSLVDDQWLTVKALAGTHAYQFRYYPADVAIGLLVTISGFVLIFYIQPRSRKVEAQSSE